MDQEFDVSAKGVASRSRGASDFRPWSHYSGIRLSKRFIVFRLTSGMVIAVPREHLTTNETDQILAWAEAGGTPVTR